MNVSVDLFMLCLDFMLPFWDAEQLKHSDAILVN